MSLRKPMAAGDTFRAANEIRAPMLTQHFAYTPFVVTCCKRPGSLVAAPGTEPKLSNNDPVLDRLEPSGPKEPSHDQRA